MLYRLVCWVMVGCGVLWLFGCSSEEPTGDFLSPALSAQDELETFQLAPGLRIELVASEPMVEDPVVVTFDEDGRLWVVEMRGFMPDVEGNGEDAPVGRVVVLEDIDMDGEMDKRTVFLDSLVLPRAIAVVEGGALIAENIPLWFVEDTDGDLQADSKTLIDAEYGGTGLPEHSPNGLLRGLDNWYYNAKSRARYRRVEDEWVKEETEFRGQWGISQDDKGRLYYNYNWSQLHADLVPPNYFNRNPYHTVTTGLDVGLTLDRSVYPIRPNYAVNRGYVEGSLDETGRLREFTSAGGPLVYRGHAFPDAYYGNVFVCEPAGNLIKRNIVRESDFLLKARSAYPDFEFLASTDERFRPVSLATGPDGALYVVDMYRGLIQHGAYITPYLKEQTEMRGLTEPIHLGRIWRVMPEDWSRPEVAPLSGLSIEELVARLSHPNSWHRETAQRLLIERDDEEAIVLLEEVVERGRDPRGRLHALWTLEGLGVFDERIYFAALTDENPTVQSHALRILEGIAVEENEVMRILSEMLPGLMEEASSELALQIILTAGSLRSEKAIPLMVEAIEQYTDPIIRDAVVSGLKNREMVMISALWQLPKWREEDGDRSIFMEMLATSVIRRGDGQERDDMLAFMDAESSDDWRAKIVRASAFSAAEIDEQIKEEYTEGRQRYVTGCAGCHGQEGEGLPRFAPPLVNSEWVLGSEEILVRLVLHGIEGPLEVNGKLYQEPDIQTVMPAHSVLDDSEIASILTYIRLSWGHEADPIERSTVGRIRHGSQGKVTPWTPEELKESFK